MPRNYGIPSPDDWQPSRLAMSGAVRDEQRKESLYWIFVRIFLLGSAGLLFLSALVWGDWWAS
ncbi:MAG: hypothetical protein QNJ62_05005 [Methyloceanibacter sp.]|nr:hypothetical protein [Methyloceanibacter sp.]